MVDDPKSRMIVVQKENLHPTRTYSNRVQTIFFEIFGCIIIRVIMIIPLSQIVGEQWPWDYNIKS